jgi:hypothetical protein
VSTESIASPTPPAGALTSCSGCGAPLDDDQRYCLQCGERRMPMSSVLLGGLGSPAAQRSEPGASAPPPSTPAAGGRGNAVTMIAGVGVLLLAMGVGVLIGRSGASKSSATPAQVISVASAPSAAAAATPGAASAFSDDWPSGSSGFTIQLQTLPQASTQVSVVEAAKGAASAKGAKGVGALKSTDFSSLKAGSYLIYSGVYHKRAEAEKALRGLRKTFPGASVIRVLSGASAAAAPGSGKAAASGGSGVGGSESHPAPPAVVEGLKTSKGKSYEEKSKNLPDVISTG